MALDQEGRNLLEQFVRSANWEGLHPLDWGRFYDVIVHVYRRGLNITEPDLREELRRCNAPDRYDDRLALVLTHGVDLLRRYQQRN